MKPAQRRARLFKHKRPNIVQINPDNAEWMVGWQWTAYKMGEFGDLSESEFKAYARHYLSQFDVLFIAEDHHTSFSKGIGPVGYAGCFYDGWNLRPHVEWYSWASTRNKLRCTVAFLAKMRHRRDVGIILIDAEDGDWFRSLRRYIGIYKQGTIRKGRPNGRDLHTFYIRGNNHGNRRQPVRGQHQHDSRQPGPEELPHPADVEVGGRVVAQYGAECGRQLA